MFPEITCCKEDRSTCQPASQAARPAVCVGPQGENTHGLSLAPCSTGRKEGPGSRNPPILTSCFCWKRDPSARHLHQHRAQCSPGSRGDSMSTHRAAHHTESACQHHETHASVSLMSREEHSEYNPVQMCCQLSVYSSEVTLKYIKLYFSGCMIVTWLSAHNRQIFTADNERRLRG